MPEQEVTLTLNVPEGYELDTSVLFHKQYENGWGFVDEHNGKPALVETITYAYKRTLPETLNVELDRDVADRYASGQWKANDCNSVIAACQTGIAAEAAATKDGAGCAK